MHSPEGGRRPKLTPDQAELAQQLYDAREKSVAQIAELFNVPRSDTEKIESPVGFDVWRVLMPRTLGRACPGGRLTAGLVIVMCWAACVEVRTGRVGLGH